MATPLFDKRARTLRTARKAFDNNAPNIIAYSDYLASASLLSKEAYEPAVRVQRIEDVLYPVCEIAFTRNAEFSQRHLDNAEISEADIALYRGANTMGYAMEDCITPDMRLRVYENCVLPLALYAVQLKTPLALEVATDLVNRMSHLGRDYRDQAISMTESLGLNSALAGQKLRFT